MCLYFKPSRGDQLQDPDGDGATWTSAEWAHGCGGAVTAFKCKSK